jgi:hypothetical protein
MRLTAEALVVEGDDGAVTGDFAENFLEVGSFGEVAIDRGEAHVGNGIETTQGFHHALADDGGWDLGFAGAFKLANDAGDHALDAIIVDRALAGGNCDLTTMSSRSCTRSKVVKRPPQSGHSRRRRIDAFSSVGRLSFTLVFSQAQ